jgi:hypothetical protein
MQCLLNFTPRLNPKYETRFESTIQHLPNVIFYFLNYAFRACPISPRPPYPKTLRPKRLPSISYTPKKHTVSHFTSPTLISETPTFLTRGGGYQDFTTGRTSVLRRKRRRRGRRLRSYGDKITRGRGYRHAIRIIISTRWRFLFYPFSSRPRGHWVDFSFLRGWIFYDIG